jgi:predicted Fe-S protein YdhL (DUF1289 family)
MTDSPYAAGGALEGASPCIAVCALDGAGYCVGCERHIDEIVGWPRMTVQERLRVLGALPERKRHRGQPGA